MKKELAMEKEQLTKLGFMIEKLKDKVVLSESTSSHLKCELSVMKSELINYRKYLDTQRFAFEC